MPTGDPPLIVWENKAGSYGAMGWICPRCGRAINPNLNTCPFCEPRSPIYPNQWYPYRPCPTYPWYDPYPTMTGDYTTYTPDDIFFETWI